jgi:anti-sigma regulatory factor (Ser/Thr protein kinase)
MLLTAPGTARGPMMQPSRAGSGKSGKTVLDREFGAADLSPLREAVLNCACAAGLQDDRAIDVMLAMHELAANVIMHGAGRGHLVMEVLPGALHCRVTDAGSDSHATVLVEAATGSLRGDVQVPDAPPVPSWPVQHGHGLWLVRRTADQVQITSGPAGSVVYVTFMLPG